LVTEEKKLPFYDTIRREMIVRNYSRSTIRAYLSCLRSFVRYFKPRHPRELTSDDIRDYLVFLLDMKCFTSGTVNQAYSALKFLYNDLYKKPLAIGALPRPKKDRKLPVVLNDLEIMRLLTSVKNLKHRAMLMVAYGSGVRVGELVRVRVEDIDFSRRQLFIRGAKGKKDRYTIFPESIVPTFREYWKSYKVGRSGWLFGGQKPGEHISKETIQTIIRNNLGAARITKGASMHTLRHSFATHLLENGTDIRTIQELLGHKSIKTTEIYTHVTTQMISKIRSPLDDLATKNLLPPNALTSGSKSHKDSI